MTGSDYAYDLAILENTLEVLVIVKSMNKIDHVEIFFKCFIFFCYVFNGISTFLGY